MEKISDAELIDNLLEMNKKLGRVPQKIDLRLSKGSKYSSNAYRRAFGGIANALIMAGLKPHQRRGLSNDELFQDIKRIHQKLNRTPTIKEFDKYSETITSTSIINKFGNWNDFLIEANIPINQSSATCWQEILNELRRWYKVNNCNAECLEFYKIINAKKNKEFLFSTSTIKYHFPDLSWQEIMKQIDPNYITKDPFIGRHIFIGDDGQEYLSSAEKQVADVLYELKKNGDIGDYEYEKPVCPEKSWTCDFVVDGELWIEVDGMRNNRSVPYKSGKNEKINYYKENKLNYKIISYNIIDRGKEWVKRNIQENK